MNFTFLPSEWNITNLGDVAEVLDPQPDHRTPPEVLDGIPYIGVNDFLPNGEIDIKSCRKVSKEVWAKQQADILIDEGGIIFGKIGTIGFPRFLPKSSIKYALSANVVLIKPRINTFFVLYWLKSNHIARQIYRTLHTTSQPALGIIKIRQLLIAAPPPTEQRKIAEILSTWDKAIALLEQLITAKRKLKQGLMQQLLTGKKRFKEFEGSEWSQRELGKLVKIHSGESPSLYSLSPKGKHLFIKVEDLNSTTKYQQESRFYTNDIRNAIIPSGCVIFPKRGAAILNNKVRISLNDIYMDSNLMALQPNSQINIEFLYYTLVNEKLAKIADISTIPQINNKHINPYNIFVPILEEQQKIAFILSTADAEISNLEKQLAAYKQQKRGLMQQLLTGKKRVKIDEPQMQKV